MKIRPMGAELLHADRQTDMTKLIFTFCNFANVPKNPTTTKGFLLSIYQGFLWVVYI